MIDFPQLVVSVDIQRNGSEVLITPHIENPTPVTLRYSMAVRQRSSAGTSSINQEGDIQTGATSSRVRLSIPPEAACSIKLDLIQDGKVIKTVEKSCDNPAI